MRLKKDLFIKTMILAFVLMIQASFIEARGYLVLLDNSSSLRPLSSYRADIKTVLERCPRDHMIEFAPIGTQERYRKHFPFISSRKKTADRNKQVDILYSFSDMETRIHYSLEQVEKRGVLERIEELLIVSDMEPDGDEAREPDRPWEFSAGDLSDYTRTMETLNRWLRENRVEKVVVALHGWNSVPAFSFDVNNEVYQRQVQRVRGDIRDKDRGNPSVCRDLVGMGLLRVRSSFPGRVTIVNIRRRIGRKKNEQGLRSFLNQFLLKNEKQVVKEQRDLLLEPVKNDFHVRIDVDSRFNIAGDHFSVATLMRLLPKSNFAGGPYRTFQYEIRTPRYPVKRKPDIRILITGPPFHPAIQGTVRKRVGQAKTLEGNVASIELPTRQSRIEWIANNVDDLLINAVETFFPPPEKPVRIFVKVEWNGQKLDAPEGMGFKVVPHFKNGIAFQNTPEEEIRRDAGLGASCLLNVFPTAERNDLMLCRRSGEPVLVRSLSADEIRSSENIHVIIPGDHRLVIKKPVDAKFSQRLTHVEEVHFKIAAYMDIAGVENLFYQKPITVTRNTQLNLLFLPGNYQLEMIPMDNDLILSRFQPVSEGAEGEKLVLYVDHDPLVYDSSFANFQQAVIMDSNSGHYNLTQNYKKLSTESAHFLRWFIKGADSNPTADIRHIAEGLYRYWYESGIQGRIKRQIMRSMHKVFMVCDDQRESSGKVTCNTAFDVFLKALIGKIASSEEKSTDSLDYKNSDQYNRWITMLHRQRIISRRSVLRWQQQWRQGQ